jgi:hypothetical protein
MGEVEKEPGAGGAEQSGLDNPQNPDSKETEDANREAAEGTPADEEEGT